MSRVLLLIFIPLLGLVNDTTETWVVTNDSRIVITGKTNVNTFDCFHSTYQRNELLVLEEDSQGLIFDQGILTLEVSRFDCGHQIMNQDFAQTLHGDKYPEIILNLNRINLKTEINGNGIFDITIGGKKVDEIIIDLDLFRSLEKFHLHGEKELQMTDFGIEPPSKLFGLLQVEDKIKIEFDLELVRVPG